MNRPTCWFFVGCSHNRLFTDACSLIEPRPSVLRFPDRIREIFFRTLRSIRSINLAVSYSRIFSARVVALHLLPSLLPPPPSPRDSADLQLRVSADR